MSKFAPIVIFIYNRIFHFKTTIKYLKKNTLASKSDLILFCDGPKNKNDAKKVNLVRNYARNISGFKSVNLFFRKKNMGLVNNIINGVTEILKRYSKIIVLEDDMICHKNFLNYMNVNLNIYKSNKNVASIHGFNYPYQNNSKDNFFFLKGADCWGWATWRRVWKNFEKNQQILISKFKKNKELINNFNFYGGYDYYKMLRKNISKPKKSWAIKWYASAFLKELYTLYPVRSLIKNIGGDGSGENCIINYELNPKKFYRLPQIKKIKIQENEYHKIKISEFMKKNLNISYFKKILFLLTK